MCPLVAVSCESPRWRPGQVWDSRRTGSEAPGPGILCHDTKTRPIAKVKYSCGFPLEFAVLRFLSIFIQLLANCVSLSGDIFASLNWWYVFV